MKGKENVTIQIDSEIIERVEALFEDLGMDLSTATNIFLRQALRHQGIPFDVCLDKPDKTTYKTETVQNDKIR